MYSSLQSTNTMMQLNQRQKAKPDEEAAVGLLQHLNKEELQNLLDDNSKLEEHMLDLQQVKDLQTDREMMLARNKSMADFNLSLQPQLEGLKRQVGTGYEEANKLKIDLAKDKSRLDECKGRHSLDTILALLQTEAATSEETSEKLADDFCDKKMSVEAFMENFIPQRTVAQLRQVQVQKMTELVRSERSGTNSVQNNWPPASPAKMSGSVPYPMGNNSQYPAPAQPYPSGNMNMPQPFWGNVR